MHAPSKNNRVVQKATETYGDNGDDGSESRTHV